MSSVAPGSGPANGDVGPFPPATRIIYRKNPLAQVICQLRFPTILRIEAELPADFQERIRKEYPILRERTPEERIALPPNAPEAVRKMVQAALPKQKRQAAYDFLSEDEKWQVGLTSEFLALTSSEYRRYEDFWAHLAGPLDALAAVYSPVFFLRIGLRYQDVIKRSELGLKDSLWSRLLSANIAGVLAAPDLMATIKGSFSETLLDFPDHSGKVRMRYGLVETDSKEECFLIDSDFFSDQKTEIEDVTRILRVFNRQSYRLFRWCITDELHDAMEPQNIEVQ